MRMPEALRPLWRWVRSLPWQRFGAGVVAGIGALLLTFLLRLFGIGVFLPELAVDFAVGRVPGEVESWFIRTLGEGAKALAVFVAIAVFLGLYGIAATFFRRFERWVPHRWGVIALYTFAHGLIALLVVLPLLGGGFLGASTYQGVGAAVFSQLAGGWIYAAILDYLLVDVRAKFPQGFNPTRRQFLKWTVIGSIAAVLILYGLGSVSRRIQRLAFPSVAAMVAKEVTPNSEFYVVTKNVIDPVVDASSWRLAVDGLVQAPRAYTYADLLARAATQEYVTLECVSNEVGGDLISTARWTGIPLRDLLDDSIVELNADWVLFTCADGYTVAIPLAKARDPATLLAVRMNGEPLAGAHGFPARIVVPGLYGMFHAKWITRITPVQGEAKGFWQQKGWTNVGRVRATAIIATPGTDSVVRGLVQIGGVAFAGDRGISRVEVSTDGGATWAPAVLRVPPLSGLTWVLWTYDWTPPRDGSFRIRARAVDGNNAAQEPTPASPFPNGAAGYDAITLLVST